MIDRNVASASPEAPLANDARPPRLRVLIADDDPLARRSIKESLRSAGLIVIAEASGGREAVELAVHYRPDIVLMDVLMPGIDGLEATQRILARVPEQRIVLISASGDDELAITGLRCGAVGFVSKDMDMDALPRTLTGAHHGEAAISRLLAMRLVERMRKTREGTLGLRPVRSSLSGREWEVLDLLCCDAGTEEIADTLVLSVETVRSHVKSILRKLDVSSRSEAIAVAARLREEEQPSLQLLSA